MKRECTALLVSPGDTQHESIRSGAVRRNDTVGAKSWNSPFTMPTDAVSIRADNPP
jgi:hypothetical protein